MSSLTVGELIKHLSAFNGNFQLTFDFGYLQPTDFDSWRGSYDKLAIGYTTLGTPDLTVKEFLLKLKGVIGKTFTGYKGGSYTMDENTQVYVDNYGEYSNTTIIGVREQYETVYLMTQKEF